MGGWVAKMGSWCWGTGEGGCMSNKNGGAMLCIK